MINLKDVFANQQNLSHNTVDDRVLIIDGTNTFLRICSSIAHINDNGVNVGAISGFLRSIAMNIRDFNASRCIVVFDGKGGSTRRKKIYPQYKANRNFNSFRPKRPEGYELSEAEERENMMWQLKRILCYLDCLPIHIMTGEGVEADDLVAFICSQYYTANNYGRIRIVSTDRDFLQLVNETIEVYSPVKKVLYTPQKIESEFGLHHNNYLLYRTIEGDTSDNISGIKGFGLKTLLKSFPDLKEREISHDVLFEQAQKIVSESKKPLKIFTTLLENRETLELNHDVMQLAEVDIPTNVKLLINSKLQSNIPKVNRKKFKELLSEDYLNGAFKNFDQWIYSFNKMNVWTTT